MKINLNSYDFGKAEMLNNIKDKLRGKVEDGSKDRNKFFNNLLKKFT